MGESWAEAGRADGKSALSRPSGGVVGVIAAQAHQKSSLTFIFGVVVQFGTILAGLNRKNSSRSHYFRSGLLCTGKMFFLRVVNQNFTLSKDPVLTLLDIIFF